jgi:RNA polymerase sigma factor (TIGR02999 family)
MTFLSIANEDMPTAQGVDAEPPPAPEPRDEAAELFTALYEELRRLARREVRRGGAADYVSTGTLVHEAWLQIRARDSLSFEDPARFLAYAARAMRGLVIDRVRARHAQKRGGGFVITSLDTEHAEQVANPEALQEIGDALDELAALEPGLAEVVDLKFFCGFTLGDIANMKGVSERTVQRQWDKARMFLHRALGER